MKWQRLVKYIAICLAIFLIIIIFGSIITIVNFITKVSNSESSSSQNVQDIEISENIRDLSIELSISNLKIVEGEVFKVETDSKYIRVREDVNELKIVEKNAIFNNNVSQVTLYVPTNFEFRSVDIETETGVIDTNILTTNNLDLELGAGKVTLNNLRVTNESQIDTGAGKTDIANSILNNLDLDIGVGNVDVSAVIKGRSSIEAGIGTLKLNLLGNKLDYKLKVSKGIGNVRVEGNSISDNTYYGDGNNKINITGGIGSINISYENDDVKDTFTKTYSVLSKVPTDRENEYYITLQMFQGEVATIKFIDKDNLLEINKTYEFTFKTIDSINNDNIEEIFSNTSVISIKETDKVGLDQIQESF